MVRRRVGSLLFVSAIALSVWAFLRQWHDDQPRLNLRGTILTGKRLERSNLDFFGGHSLLLSSLFDCF